jgi:cold shock protein
MKCEKFDSFRDHQNESYRSKYLGIKTSLFNLSNTGGNNMVHGTTKFFNEQKGWGILTGDDGVEVFVHYKSIISEGFKTLKQGQKVSYEVVQAEKGLQAINVTPVL